MHAWRNTQALTDASEKKREGKKGGEVAPELMSGCLVLLALLCRQ